MSLRKTVKEGKFVFTSEIGPPKGVELNGILEEVESLKGLVEAINVTDNQSSVMRLGSLPLCHLLKERGVEPVFQLTCRDRNRLALQTDLLSAWVLGIENVLVLTGDHTTLGDHPQAKPVFDLDSVGLLEVIQMLNQGKDMMGNALSGRPNFFPGAVVNPGQDPLEPQIIKLEKKVEAGAKFIQTQAVYEPEKFEKFMNKISHLKIPILCGIVLLKSAGMARFMNKNVAGVEVPESLIQRMSEAKDRKKESIEIAVEIINKVKPLCQGIHLMPLGWDDLVPPIISRVKEGEKRWKNL